MQKVLKDQFEIKLILCEQILVKSSTNITNLNESLNRSFSNSKYDTNNDVIIKNFKTHLSNLTNENSMDEDKEDAIHFINVLSVHINLFNDLIRRGIDQNWLLLHSFNLLISIDYNNCSNAEQIKDSICSLVKTLNSYLSQKRFEEYECLNQLHTRCLLIDEEE